MRCALFLRVAGKGLYYTYFPGWSVGEFLGVGSKPILCTYCDFVGQVFNFAPESFIL